ncbi:MAG: serine O-acetyltransferase EpsC [Verrucomicrobiota bacterium]
MDSFLPQLVDDLLDSYAECGGINHIDGINLPSKGAIASITQDLLSILFPGFHSDRVLKREELPEFAAALLSSIQQRLHIEISKSLDYRPVPETTAEAILEAFLKSLAQTRCTVQTDVEASFDGDPAATSTEEVILAYPGIEAIAVQRLAHTLYKLGVALIPRMMTEWAHARSGIDIHPGAQIGTHFFIDHGTGVVIGETTVIGNYVRVYQGVTLGGRSVAHRVTRNAQGQATTGKRHPTIEDEVTIYSAATILGGDTVIGARSVVGGNVWLTQSVPPDSVASFEALGVQIRSRKKNTDDFQI